MTFGPTASTVPGVMQTRDIEQYEAAAGKGIKRTTDERFTAWAEFGPEGMTALRAACPGMFADTVRREVRKLTGPEVNRQTIQWRREGAARVGYTREAQ